MLDWGQHQATITVTNPNNPADVTTVRVSITIAPYYHFLPVVSR
jgi:hypothetical protein